MPNIYFQFKKKNSSILLENLHHILELVFPIECRVFFWMLGEFFYYKDYFFEIVLLHRWLFLKWLLDLNLTSHLLFLWIRDFLLSVMTKGNHWIKISEIPRVTTGEICQLSSTINTQSTPFNFLIACVLFEFWIWTVYNSSKTILDHH